MDITEYIPTGADRRVTSKHLENILHVSGSQIRVCVNNARKEHQPICSDSNGYFIAETPNDLDHTIAQLSSRIKALSEARNGLLAAREQMTNDTIYNADMFGFTE